MDDSIVITIVAVVDGAGNLLWIRRVNDSDDSNAHKWEFPAGHVDPGEISSVAGAREVEEETGLKILLLPHGIIIPTKKGKAAYYLGFVLDKNPKPEVTLAEDEHDAYRWVSPKRFDSVQPTHKKMKENLIDLLQHVHEELGIGKRKSGEVVSGRDLLFLRRRVSTMADTDFIQGSEEMSTRYTRRMPGPGEELKEAILVGDEVEIFLKEHAIGRGETPEPSISGIVEKRDRNTIWVRDENKETQGISWNDRGEWAFLRVYRGPNQVVYYANGNPYADQDAKDVAKARGLGLILESDPPTRYESVWALMRGETPDLDLTAGQPPQSMDRVAPFRTPKAGVPEILHQVQDVIERYKLEPDRVESLGKGRVLILTQDGDLKRELIRVLEKNGKKVDASRKGALIVRPYPRRVQGVTTMGVTTVPIAEDEDLMLLTRRKRERDLADQEREESRTGKKRKAQNYTPPNVTVAPSPTPAYQQQFQGQQQQGGPQQADPQTSVIIPSSQEQIQLLKDKYGANLTTTNMPGGETKINFANPAQMQKYTNDQKKITLQGPSSSRRARQEMVRTARELGQSLNDDDYETAHLHLNNLRDLGVKEETIIRSSLAGRQTWANFSRYLESRGEIENSRVARRASRFAGSL